VSQKPSINSSPFRKLFILLCRICAFLAVFQTIGPNLSYGVFQDFYVANSRTILPPHQATNRALIAFVGTLGAGLTWGGSIYVNPLMARTKNPKWIAVPGAILMSLGFLLASWSTQVCPSSCISYLWKSVH